MLPANIVHEAVDTERAYQDWQWGSPEVHPHEVGAWILLLDVRINKARDSWAGQRGDDQALLEILKVAALATACLQQHGVVKRDGTKTEVA